MNGKEDFVKNSLYYSGSYFKQLNGNKYGKYRQATKTIKVKGHFEDIYNYVEENIHMWIGSIAQPVSTAGLDEAMVERLLATQDEAQKMAVKKQVSPKFCHYTAGDLEGDSVDITVIKGFLFLKTRVNITLNGYSGYCKDLIKIIEEKIEKLLEAQ